MSKAWDFTPISRRMSSKEPNTSQPPQKGYHLADIPKGKIGEWSKVEEEWAEFSDAKYQNSRILQLVELADTYGAVHAWIKATDGTYSDIRFQGVMAMLEIEVKLLGYTLEDLRKFSEITERAFAVGQR